MDREILRRVGEALYSPTPGWHEPLADDLSVDVRTLQRWASGRREIPEIQGELAALCHEKSRAFARMAKMSPNIMADDQRAGLIAERRERADELARLAVELGYGTADSGSVG